MRVHEKGDDKARARARQSEGGVDIYKVYVCVYVCVWDKVSMAGGGVVCCDRREETMHM